MPPAPSDSQPSHDDQPAGWHGAEAAPDTHHASPFAALISAVAAIVIGVVIGLALVRAVPVPTGAHASSHDPIPRVKELEGGENGPAVERLPDGTTIPWNDTPPPAPAGSTATAHAHASIPAPLWLSLPFALLLASIALMPFLAPKFWHRHYPDVAFLLGALVLSYLCAAFGSAGRYVVTHTALEYYSFIALVGGLYVCSGGILVDSRDRASPLSNVGLLGLGAILANVVGTTGASVLLIRPFMRMNKGRLKPIHVVMFIFVVSNCGGCLTPIGDPPLYLGFLKGVPFSWTLTHMWPMWLFVVGSLLVIFYFIDLRIGPAPEGPTAPPVPMSPGHDPRRPHLFDPQHRTPLIAGWPAAICLLLIVACVFVDPILKHHHGIEGYPIGATLQVLIAAASFVITPRSVRHANQFSFGPVREVAFLFVGIFLTMAPALAYLEANSAALGLESPTQFYFFTGSLSAVLDNAPTYLSFLQAALGVLHLPLDPTGIARFIQNVYEVIDPDGQVTHFRGQVLLEAIALGAVFFGAMTYIGNGPNFMVKAIAEQNGVRMPSFFSYLLHALVILLPILVLAWLIFIR